MLKTAVKTGLCVGVLLGSIFGFIVAGVGGLLPYARDAYLFVLAGTAVSALVCSGAFLVVGILFHLVYARRRAPEPAKLQWIPVAGVFCVVFSLAAFGLAELFRPVSPLRPATIAVIIAVAAVSIVVSRLLASLFATIGRQPGVKGRLLSWTRLRVWLPVYLGALVIAVVLGSLGARLAPLRKGPVKAAERRGKVLLLGLDSANWSTLSPLIERGKLPNLEKVVREGASGNLTSLVGMWEAFAGDAITYGIHSPAIWTTIVTGKEPSQHGIKDFVFTEVPWLEHPFRYRLVPEFVPYREGIEHLLGLRVRPGNRFLRKCKAAWNILGDAGLRVGALGWWATWPVEDVRADIVSDRLADPDLLKKWNPPNLVSREDMESLRSEIESFPTEDLAYFTGYPYDPGFRNRFEKGSAAYIRNELVDKFMSYFLMDKYRSGLGLRLLAQHDYALMAVYYYALDVAGHAFTRFREPELFADIQPKDVEYFGQTIDKYYMWFDGELGKYLEQLDGDTTLIICSDHGMGPWLKVASVRSGLELSGSHRLQGVVMMYGNHVRKGTKIERASVLDVFPTILYLVGMPVAQDMDGGVLWDGIDPEYRQRVPVQMTDTYETERYRYNPFPGAAASPAADQKQMDRLRSLGYVK
jgi:hypothetical protein